MTARRLPTTLAAAMSALCLAAHGCNQDGLIGRLCVDPACVRDVDTPPPSDCVEPPCESPADAAVPPQDASPPEPADCPNEVHALERTRLDLYLVVDDSGSMVFNWDQTLAGLQQFLNDPASAGIGVGLQLFGTSCDAASYATPRVPIEALPGNAAALSAALPAIPLQESSTLPALQGAVSHARDWARSHPRNKVVIVLMTDSLSEECGSSVESVSEVARDGFQSSPSVQTFVVTFGLGAELASALNSFASAGGTQGAVRTNATDRAPGIHQALANVRDTALPCTFTATGSLPLLAAARSRIEYTSPDGATNLHSIASDCDAAGAGATFSVDPREPGLVHACPETCAGLELGGSLRWTTACERL